MKKLVISLLLAIPCLVHAQKDVTTFLGIPVDGYKSEMKKKLISKGFTPKTVKGNEFLEGEFNGVDVHVYIGTNNNKVYRIMLCDADTRSEANIKIRFNNLVSQFKKNKRYTSFDNFTISDTEDISYEMLVNKKNYDAVFFQIPNMEKLDTLASQEKIRNELLKIFSPEQLANPNDEVVQRSKDIALQLAMDMTINKSVWFRICESYGEYYITMYYDNEYNKADGEDL